MQFDIAFADFDLIPVNKEKVDAQQQRRIYYD